LSCETKAQHRASRVVPHRSIPRLDPA